MSNKINIYENIFDSDYFQKKILNDLKNQTISLDDAIKYNKIISVLSNYNTYKEMKNEEDSYYEKYGCGNELEKVLLETKYLNKKIYNLYTNELNDSDLRNRLLIIMIELMSMKKSINSNISYEELEKIKKNILDYEILFNIEFKFLTEAYIYLIEKLDNSEVKKCK